MNWQGDLDHPEYRKLVAAIAERVGAAKEQVDRQAAIGPRDVVAPRAGGAAELRGTPALSVLRGRRRGDHSSAGRIIRFWPGGDPHVALSRGSRTTSISATSRPNRSCEPRPGTAAAWRRTTWHRCITTGTASSRTTSRRWTGRCAAPGWAMPMHRTTRAIFSPTVMAPSRTTRRRFSWYLKAADQGFGPAAYNVGLFYQDGRATSPDPLKAVEYYRLALDLGHPAAGNALGDMYRLGRGVGVDLGSRGAVVQGRREPRRRRVVDRPRIHVRKRAGGPRAG